jgi:hypothetical protein
VLVKYSDICVHLETHHGKDSRNVNGTDDSNSTNDTAIQFTASQENPIYFKTV